MQWIVGTDCRVGGISFRLPWGFCKEKFCYDKKDTGYSSTCTKNKQSDLYFAWEKTYFLPLKSYMVIPL